MHRTLTLAILMTIAASMLQAQTFSAAAVLGFNAAQVDGDQLAGFDKVGLVGGLRGSALLGEKTDLHVEFLYSHRGSRPDIFNATVDPDIELKLNYIDLPVYISYSDWYDERGFYKMAVNGGVSFGRLISARTFDRYNEEEINLDNLANDFNENELSFLLGFTFRSSEHIVFSGRYTQAITPLLNAEKLGYQIPNLRSYWLSFRIEYLF